MAEPKLCKCGLNYRGVGQTRCVACRALYDSTRSPRQRRPRPRFSTANVLSRAKMRARQMTKRAIVSGMIVKKPCDKCSDPNSEVHHIIYPDVIRWLCKPCHRLVERQMKAKGLNAPVRDTMFGFDHIDPVEWVRMLERGDVLESEPEKLSKAG